MVTWFYQESNRVAGSIWEAFRLRIQISRAKITPLESQDGVGTSSFLCGGGDQDTECSSMSAYRYGVHLAVRLLVGMLGQAFSIPYLLSDIGIAAVTDANRLDQVSQLRKWRV